MQGPDKAAAYAEAFLERMKGRDDVGWSGPPGRDVLYRPGQLLVPAQDRERVAQELARLVDVLPASAPPARPGQIDRGRLEDRTSRRLFERVSGTAVLEWRQRGDDPSVPAVLAALRDPQRWGAAPVPAVLPHLVFTGTPNIMGHPARPPAKVAAPQSGPPQGRGAGITIGVCDTGIWDRAAVFHTAWLGAFAQDARDVDGLLGPGGVLDLQAGHGTFVAGVLRQAAPQSPFDPERALDPMGVGDLQSVVVALARLRRGAAVVNLSLGCYSEDDLAPPPLARALARLGRHVVVVAAAGNFGESRPTWPAAFKRVIAVAAVEQTARGPRPADYSNRGPWVDACAVGTRTSTYVEGPASTGERFEGWAEWAGTSFAAPHVAGTIAADVRPGEGGSAWPAARRLLDQDPWHPDFGVLVP